MPKRYSADDIAVGIRWLMNHYGVTSLDICRNLKGPNGKNRSHQTVTGWWQHGTSDLQVLGQLEDLAAELSGMPCPPGEILRHCRDAKGRPYVSSPKTVEDLLKEDPDIFPHLRKIGLDSIASMKRQTRDAQIGGKRVSAAT